MNANSPLTGFLITTATIAVLGCVAVVTLRIILTCLREFLDNGENKTHSMDYVASGKWVSVIRVNSGPSIIFGPFANAREAERFDAPGVLRSRLARSGERVDLLSLESLILKGVPKRGIGWQSPDDPNWFALDEPMTMKDLAELTHAPSLADPKVWMHLHIGLPGGMTQDRSLGPFRDLSEAENFDLQAWARGSFPGIESLEDDITVGGTILPMWSYDVVEHPIMLPPSGHHLG